MALQQKKKIFLASDHHLFHKKIIESLGRNQFKHIEEHNEFILEKHNSVVGPNDVCKFLGDVCLETSCVDDYKILDQFNGKKHLIIGNHDTPRRIREYIDKGYFDKVMAYDTLGTQDSIKAEYLLSHVPVHVHNLETRFKKCIHGHLHNDIILSPDGTPDKRYICVSMERIGYTPVPFEDIISEKINFWKKI